MRTLIRAERNQLGGGGAEGGGGSRERSPGAAPPPPLHIGVAVLLRLVEASGESDDGAPVFAVVRRGMGLPLGGPGAEPSIISGIAQLWIDADVEVL